MFNFEDKLYILHLEDSLNDQKLTEISLRKSNLNFEITFVDNLEDFKDNLLNKKNEINRNFDLILADYYLNNFTALDVFESIKNLNYFHKLPPFILLSGAIGETLAVKAIQNGFSDFIAKENIDNLAETIKKVLEIYYLKKEKEQVQNELKNLNHHLQTLIENERKSIARYIHDEIGGNLSALQFDISWLLRNYQNKKNEDFKIRINSALSLLKNTLNSCQNIILNLRPPILEQGLIEAISWVTLDFEKRTKIKTNFNCDCDLKNLNNLKNEIQIVAYRVAQESLTNIIKHSKADLVNIEISDKENILTLEISDNGIGFDKEKNIENKKKSFGLIGLNERVKNLNGWLDISSIINQGTTIIMSIPLNN